MRSSLAIKGEIEVYYIETIVICYGNTALLVRMSVEQWWNDTDRGKLKYWEKNIVQCGR